MTVYLVGSGPGDPELITVRGARLLAEADVVIHDRLAAPVLKLARPTAELLDVGKTPGLRAVSQDEINRLLVEHGRRLETVVRLKGGDPFVFARGAEELLALRAAGIAVEVVPGISSILAAPAAAGTPLTVRGVSSSFTVLTGHEDPAAVPPDRWRAVAALGGTIVVLMGARTIGAIAERLIEAGLAPSTPVVAVAGATTEGEEIARTTLTGVRTLGLAPPVVFVVGEVGRFGEPTRDAPGFPVSARMSHRRAKMRVWARRTERVGGRSR